MYVDTPKIPAHNPKVAATLHLQLQLCALFASPGSLIVDVNVKINNKYNFALAAAVAR